MAEHRQSIWHTNAELPRFDRRQNDVEGPSPRDLPVVELENGD